MKTFAIILLAVVMLPEAAHSTLALLDRAKAETYQEYKERVDYEQSVDRFNALAAEIEGK